MHNTAILTALLAIPLALAFTPPGYDRNVPPPLEDYRSAYRQFKQEQEKHRSVLATLAPPPLLHNSQGQQVMNPDLGPALPPSDPSSPGKSAGGNEDSQLTIADILPAQRQINIFAGLTRDIESLTGRLESAGSNTTLLAPLNSAMQQLPRKPWEDRPDDNSGVSAARDEDKAAANLRRFVLEHVVPVSPWREGKEHAVSTMWDAQEQTDSDKVRKIWWERRWGGPDGSEEKKVIMPGEVVVERVVGRVGNGEVWALKNVINY